MTIRLVFILAAAFGLSSAEAVTKHYSFSGGYPTTRSATKTVEEKALVGTVTQIVSGNVIWVTPKGGRKTKVKLADADAPEQGQNFGVEAKKFLFDLANGKKVTVRYYAKDSSGAISGTVMLEHEKGLVDVNLTLIRNGCAWYVETPRPDGVKSNTSQTKAYAAGEKEARDSKRGLWAAPNPVKPAEWRKLHR